MPFLDVVEDVLVHGVGGSLPLQLVDNHTAIVARSEQVQGGVGSHHPETVILPTERLNSSPTKNLVRKYFNLS